MWLPINFLVIFSFYLIYNNYININYFLIFCGWFLIGLLGIGVGFHRLFSHRQFETHRIIEIILAILGTLSAYGPIIYWISQHQHHHKYADTDEDINDPKKGFWHSFLYWRLKKESIKKIHIKNYCTIKAAKDPIIVFLNKHFYKIIYSVVVLLILIDFTFFISFYLIPIFIEHNRIGILNSLSHMKFFGSYKVANNDDNSYNNILLGYLTLGFGWHNFHHKHPEKMINTHYWWEIDFEGIICRALSKKNNY